MFTCRNKSVAGSCSRFYAYFLSRRGMEVVTLVVTQHTDGVCVCVCGHKETYGLASILWEYAVFHGLGSSVSCHLLVLAAILRPAGIKEAALRATATCLVGDCCLRTFSVSIAKPLLDPAVSIVRRQS